MVIVHAFIDAITRGWIHIGMRIMKEFEEIILKNDKRVLPSLLQSFKDSPYLMDLKLSMLKLFLPLLQFHYIDVLITNREADADDIAAIEAAGTTVVLT